MPRESHPSTLVAKISTPRAAWGRGKEQQPIEHGDWDLEKEKRMEGAQQQDLEKEEAQQWPIRAVSRGDCTASRSNDVQHSDSASPLREGLMRENRDGDVDSWMVGVDGGSRR